MPEQPLTWTRPDFLALRYELQSAAGLAATVGMSGLGELKHAVATTSEGAWQFQVFPFASDSVVITGAEDRTEVGTYRRRAPFEIRLATGELYRLTPQGLESESARQIFSYEQLESFPRWKAEVKLAADAVELAELPLLVVTACCIQVFR